MEYSSTEYVKELWNADEETWMQELCKYHPANSGLQVGNALAPGFNLNVGFKSGKEFANWVHNAIVGYVNESAAMWRTVICEKLDYCNRMHDALLKGEEWNAVLAVADSLAMYASGIPVPLLLLSTYVVKHHVLGTLCNCGKQG